MKFEDLRIDTKAEKPYTCNRLQCLNMSSIFMIPFELTAFYLPLALHKKQLRIVVRYVILILPCMLMAALYMLTKNHILIYTGK